MTAATEAGYAAVGDPVEGTILTVARAASDAAQVAATRKDATLVRVLRAAASAARDALDHTPSSCRCSPTPVWSTREGAACAWCSTRSTRL